VATSALSVASGAAAEPVVRALTGDIVVIRGKLYYKRGKGKKAVYEPVELDLHINPVSLALGAGAAALMAGVGLWWMGLEVRKLSDEERARLEALLAAKEARLATVEERLAAGDERAACREHCYTLTNADLILECLKQCDEQQAEDIEEAKILRREVADLKRRLLGGGFRIENRARLSDWDLGSVF